MGRTIRFGVAISISVSCLAVLTVSVGAKKKPKSRRSKTKVTRMVLPPAFVPQVNVPVATHNAVPSAGETLNSDAPARGKLRHIGAPPPAATVPPIQAGQVIISEMRLRGPAGAEDEFVELYNNTDSPITVQALDASAGWSVVISDGQIAEAIFTIPNGTSIPARGHLLGANTNGYSLTLYPSGNPGPSPSPGPYANTTPDRTWDFDVPDGSGVALFATTNGTNLTAGTRLDAAGFTTSPALYKEGNGIASIVTINTEHTYYRDLRTTTPRDTGDNAADFLLVGPAPSIQVPRLGAPGPENLNSPVVKNSTIGSALLDSTKASSSAPNRVRDFTVEDPNTSLFGTMLLRRRFTNNTGAPVTRLRFRIINITTFGTPASECGGTPCADLRVVSSADGTVGGILDPATCAAEPGSPAPPCIVTVKALTLEQPPDQLAGGGYNSSLSANSVSVASQILANTVNLASPLQPGQSINVTFKMGIQRTGSFRVIVNIEAANAPVIVTAPN
jgi:Lamin Tail Domain